MLNNTLKNFSNIQKRSAKLTKREVRNSRDWRELWSRKKSKRRKMCEELIIELVKSNLAWLFSWLCVQRMLLLCVLGSGCMQVGIWVGLGFRPWPAGTWCSHRSAKVRSRLVKAHVAFLDACALSDRPLIHVLEQILLFYSLRNGFCQGCNIVLRIQEDEAFVHNLKTWGKLFIVITELLKDFLSLAFGQFDKQTFRAFHVVCSYV